MANQCPLERNVHETADPVPVMQHFILREADQPRIPPRPGEAVMVPRPLIRLVSPATEAKGTQFTGVMKRFGSGHIAQALLKTPPRTEIDPYLLLVLADQELIEGREEQARYLIEAAYEVFDQKAEASVSALYRTD